MELLILCLIAIYVIVYRKNNGQKVYRFIVSQASFMYEKYAPYSFKTVSAKAKELKQEYTIRQYTIQIVIFAGGAFVISWLYFYNVIVSIIYCLVAIAFIP